MIVLLRIMGELNSGSFTKICFLNIYLLIINIIGNMDRDQSNITNPIEFSRLGCQREVWFVGV